MKKVANLPKADARSSQRGFREKTLIPRLPMAAREKLKSGGTHKNKKTYARKGKHNKNNAGEPSRPQFFTHKLAILNT